MASSGNTWQKKLMAKSKTQWKRRVLGTEQSFMVNRDTRPGLVEVGSLPTAVTFKPTRDELNLLIAQYKGTVTVGEPGRYIPAMGKGRAAFNVGGCGDGHARKYLAVALAAG